MKSGLVGDRFYYHQHNGAYFNPHAYVARVSGMEGLANGAGVDLLSADRALLHEMSHWFQYMGTSFGLAVGLHRWQQYVTGIDILTDGGGTVAESILSKRVAGDPLVLLDGDGNFVSTEFSGENSKVLTSVWHAQLVTDRVMTDTGSLSRHLRLPFEFETMVGDFFVDVVGSPVLFGEPATLPQDPRGCVKDCPAGVDDYLTSRAIMECAAVINEYASLSAGSEESRLLRERTWRQFLGAGVYGAAGRYFCQVIGCGDVDVEAWLGSILTCCDIALNPIIPPLVELDFILDQPVSWSKLSPTWRFIRCVEACRRLPPCRLEDLPGSAAELSQIIASIAGLEHWNGKTLGFHSMSPFLDQLAKLDFESVSTVSGESLFLSYFSTVAREVWRLREDGDIQVFAHGILAREGLLSPEWFTMPPLLTDQQHRRFWHPKPLTSPSTLPFATMLMGIYAVADIVSGSGPLDFSAFPSGLKERAKGAIVGLQLGDVMADMPLRFSES